MKNLIIVSVLLLIFCACKKEENKTESPTVIPKSVYTPLDSGNYWIYQQSNIDTDNVETINQNIDSVVVSKDTLINGKQYFVFEDFVLQPGGIVSSVSREFLRDSSGYLVSETGRIYFYEDDFSDTLHFETFVVSGDTLYQIAYKMEKVTVAVTVPAGSFNVLDFKGTLWTWHLVNGVTNPRYTHTYYHDGVGKVMSEQWYVSSPVRFVKKLLRYSLPLTI
jgi:hypothetical protein